MITRYAIRKTATGEFWGRARQWPQPRKWENHIDKANLWHRRGDLSNALNYVPEIVAYVKEQNLPYFPSYLRDEILKTLGLEIMEFNVLLIDAKKGYL